MCRCMAVRATPEVLQVSSIGGSTQARDTAGRCRLGEEDPLGIFEGEADPWGRRARAAAAARSGSGRAERRPPTPGLWRIWMPPHRRSRGPSTRSRAALARDHAGRGRDQGARRASRGLAARARARHGPAQRDPEPDRAPPHDEAVREGVEGARGDVGQERRITGPHLSTGLSGPLPGAMGVAPRTARGSKSTSAAPSALPAVGLAATSMWGSGWCRVRADRPWSVGRGVPTVARNRCAVVSTDGGSRCAPKSHSNRDLRGVSPERAAELDVVVDRAAAGRPGHAAARPGAGRRDRVGDGRGRPGGRHRPRRAGHRGDRLRRPRGQGRQELHRHRVPLRLPEGQAQRRRDRQGPRARHRLRRRADRRRARRHCRSPTRPRPCCSRRSSRPRPATP